MSHPGTFAAAVVKTDDMPDCEYCGNSFGTDGALVDHLIECEDRSALFKQFSDDYAEDWFDSRFSKPTAARVHGILDDIAIIFESLYPLPDAVFAAGLLAQTCGRRSWSVRTMASRVAA
jgi:hypothetical protein